VSYVYTNVDPTYVNTIVTTSIDYWKETIEVKKGTLSLFDGPLTRPSSIDLLVARSTSTPIFSPFTLELKVDQIESVGVLFDG
jgi:hypothetical protein